VSAHRGIMLSAGDRNLLERVAAGLERKNFRQDAAGVRGIVTKFDAADGFTVLHRSALAERVAPVESVEHPVDEGEDPS
jgi:hypothetical protein